MEAGWLEIADDVGCDDDDCDDTDCDDTDCDEDTCDEAVWEDAEDVAEADDEDVGRDETVPDEPDAAEEPGDDKPELEEYFFPLFETCSAIKDAAIPAASVISYVEEEPSVCRITSEDA